MGLDSRLRSGSTATGTLGSPDRWPRSLSSQGHTRPAGWGPPQPFGVRCRQRKLQNRLSCTACAPGQPSNTRIRTRSGSDGARESGPAWRSRASWPARRRRSRQSGSPASGLARRRGSTRTPPEPRKSPKPGRAWRRAESSICLRRDVSAPPLHSSLASAGRGDRNVEFADLCATASRRCSREPSGGAGTNGLVRQR
jgi:hypothetical protein